MAAARRHRPRVFIETPLGRKVTFDVFLDPLADFLASKHATEKPNSPPGDLAHLIDLLEPRDLALCVLTPLLHSIWRHEWDQDEDPARALCQNIGEHLRDRLAAERAFWTRIDERKTNGRGGRAQAWKYLGPDWDPPHCVKAGHWLMQCAMSLDYFDYDDDGFPKIADHWKSDVDRIREGLLWRDPVLLPHKTPPPDWTGWRAEYGDKLQKNFVRDWHPETKKSIEGAFRDPNFEHARGVSALQRVPFRIDTQMLGLVSRRAADVMNVNGRRDAKQRRADKELVAYDASVANWVASDPFHLTYNCDTRGRVYPIPHFNYGREDHVRALFKFANGTRLFPCDLKWLEIHCANCQGDTDKDPWEVRINWAKENRTLIQKIATDPEGTFNLWYKADKPFRYVAACRELAAAWADPGNFITHLPIAFDGSANGIQHLALIIRDADAGRKVNLTNLEKPQDVYGEVVAKVRSAIEADSGEWAEFWRNRFDCLSNKKIRKLIKTPAMTFAYNVTPYGMADQIKAIYPEISQEEPPEGRARFYLADRIREACKEVLPGPAEVMEYICSLAGHCADEDRPLEWTSPTGFPICIRHQKPKLDRVRLVANGRRVEYRVANGHEPGIVKLEARNAAAPNFVHSLDASHLIRTVNAAVSEGITDIVTVHDSFSCLAPQAQRFNQLIRRELLLMYASSDMLHRLRYQNVRDLDAFPLPEFGELDVIGLQDAEYSFS